MEKPKTTLSRSEFLKRTGLMTIGGGLLGLAACHSSPQQTGSSSQQAAPSVASSSAQVAVAGGEVVEDPTHLPRVAADPSKLPPSPTYNSPQVHEVHLTVEETLAELKKGVIFRFMPFNGQVPGPMIRVRQGDTIDLHFTSSKKNKYPHNIDFHSVYGTGGGAVALTVGPGQTKHIRFKVMYPGAFIYHCAVPDLDMHISSGMFGMMVVEPPEGLPPVDREFYIGQHEVYVKPPVNDHTEALFDMESMLQEIPTYVVFNGAFNGLTAERYGPMQAKQKERVRIFFVNGGPNLSSSFHPIGNVWTHAWRDGGLANSPEKYLQTINVPPGSCAVVEMDLPVPETIHLADHSITRYARQGLRADIVVSGKPVPDIFNDHP
ncbi:MAG: nitrite reductase, copper-containing [Thermoflavifilum sp.]|nr:nitrite reductase, copper-containing [Thermoflavifilum sp.]